MVTADLEAWRERLLTSPWVADAEIRRMFPDAVSVRLVERTAAAIGRVDGTMYLVDGSGSVIDEFGPSYAELDLPIIDGMGTGRSGAFLVDPARARLASRLLASLQARPDLLERVSEINVSNPRDVTVMLSGDTTLLRLGRDRFVDRIQAYVDLAPRLRERVPDIDTVDLRYDTRVYVQGSKRGAGRRS
jgi:cell division protein FtsQ